ncbi:serine/threonine-protein kinase [Sphaerisporangium fuscum]|uniref:serine/threonine-protein kinase n=1 Tax=Sphaerisporangium fuscum TaxID=2835868 RepID=UPI001BDC5126|nr:serine/threonine-protein kinase [Sphaerisporangium fuscum]
MSGPAPLRAEDPDRLGAYRLTGRLGRGGQGVVYLGLSPQGARVAVKLMHARLDEERARRRFAAEVEAVRRVAPFCTVQVLDADLEGDRPYIVSEYVEGVSLQEHITAEGPRTGGSLDRLAVGTATALAAIHGAGVVHRDFKPGNVLIGGDGPRVIDFGISRIMDAASMTGGTPVGTPAYLSPEQLRGEPAGPAADMFGWALTVAFAASGRHAYAAGSSEAVLGRILFGEPDLAPLTGRLHEIVVACLASDPADRPSADEALRHLIGQGPAAVPPGRMLSTGATLASAGGRVRRRWPAVVGGLAVLAAGVAAAALWWGGGAAAFSYAGRWTGVAEHPTAGRVFPVEIRVDTAGGGGTMRWGADLHCVGRLTKVGGKPAEPDFRLDEVHGEECKQGSLHLSPDGSEQVRFQVTASGEPRYFGTASRSS